MYHLWSKLTIKILQNNPLISHFLLLSLQMGWDFLVRLKISFLWCAALVWLKGRGQWKTKSPREGVRALPFLPPAQKEEVEVSGSGSWPCSHTLWAPRCAGETAGKLCFKKCALRLLSCPVTAVGGVQVSGALAEMPLGRIHSLWLLFLEQSKTIGKDPPPSCSLSYYFASFCALRNPLREGLWTCPGWKKWTFLAF